VIRTTLTTRKGQAEAGGQLTRRTLVLGGGMGGMILALAARMRYLGIEEADQFRLLAEENRISVSLLPPTRGLIQDRNGKLLAGNAPNYRIILTPEAAGDVGQVLDRLSHLLPISPNQRAEILAEVKARSRFVPITVTDQLDWESFARVASNGPALPGITPDVGLSRVYPRDTDFAHVLGYVGPVTDKDLEGQDPPDPVLMIPKFQIGKIGVERWMEAELRGHAGSKRTEVNHVGRVMRELGREPGIAGADLVLTINAGLQNFVQARLGTESAACVVMDVQTGDVLACVSSPSFDPNLFVRGISHKDYNNLTENDHRPLANKTVQGLYPPGSTFKMVTVLAALDAGVIDLETRVKCPGFLESGGRKFHCWRRGGHGTVGLTQSLEESCDVFYYDIAQKVGIDKIAEMGQRLGMGFRHDLPMSAIAEGVMPNKAWKQETYAKDWVIGDTINAAIGQGFVLTSPLQLAVMTARIASGTDVAPRLVRAIGGRPAARPTVASLGLASGHLDAVRKGMFDVMNGGSGTARGARIADETMRFAGKTGTAQVRNIGKAERDSGVIANNNLPWELRDHALFVGYAPYDNPRYAVSVVVEHGGGGSTAAAPLGRDAILYALFDGLPPVTAYPADQRGRMESLLRDLILRRPEDDPPTPGRA
jgi:penicillin-binding protein 2